MRTGPLCSVIMFIAFLVFGWAAISMSFSITLWNLILAVMAGFFLFRALELVDKVNKLGPYAPKDEQEAPHAPKTLGQGEPGEGETSEE